MAETPYNPHQSDPVVIGGYDVANNAKVIARMTNISYYADNDCWYGDLVANTSGGVGTVSFSDSQATGTINADLDTVVLALPGGQSTFLIQALGSFSGTLLFEATPDGGTTYYPITANKVGVANTQASSTTVASAWYGNISGYTHLHVKGHPFTSGPANILIRLSQGVSSVTVNNAQPLGQTVKTASTSVAIASDQIVPTLDTNSAAILTALGTLETHADATATNTALGTLATQATAAASKADLDTLATIVSGAKAAIKAGSGDIAAGAIADLLTLLTLAGTSTDANTVNSLMGRLTKIRDLLASTLTVSGTVNTLHGSTIDATNSSTTPLTANSVFTGTSQSSLNYSAISLEVFADQASAAGGLSVQQSTDGTNWDIKDAFSIVANTAFQTTVNLIGQSYKVVYTNGGTNQGAFRLQTVKQTSENVLPRTLTALGNLKVALAEDNTAGLATSANQASTNTSLTTIATNTTGVATAANQATANTSLASIKTDLDTVVTQTASLATHADQTTLNTTLGTLATQTTAAASKADLDTIVTQTVGLATSALQTTMNTTLGTLGTQTTLAAAKADLDTIVTNTTGGATAANQATGNTSLASIKTDLDTIVTQTASLETHADSTTINTTLGTLATQTTAAAMKTDLDTLAGIVSSAKAAVKSGAGDLVDLATLLTLAGASGDANSVASFMGRFTKIRDLLALFTFDGNGYLKNVVQNAGWTSIYSQSVSGTSSWAGTGDLNVSAYKEVMISVKMSALTGTSITFLGQRKDGQGIYSNLWTPSAFTTPTIGANTSWGAGLATGQVLGPTIAVNATLSSVTAYTFTLDIQGR